MATTSTKKRPTLTDYIKEIYEVEKNIYMLKQYRSLLNRRIKQLESWQPEPDININNTQDTRISTLESNIDQRITNSSGAGMIASVIAGFIAFVIPIIYLVTRPYAGNPDAGEKVAYTIFRIIAGCLIGAVSALVVAFIVGAIVKTVFSVKENQDYGNYRKKLLNEINDYNASLSQRNQKNQDIIDEKIEIMYDEYDFVQEQLETMETVLSKLYSYDIVFSKYRNITAISSFYEYLESGRCSSLKGAHGAYNLYEAELRQGIIIDKLNIIINKLEDIKNNQYLLYSAILDIGDRIEMLNSNVISTNDKLQDLNNNMEIANYHTEIIAENQVFQSRLMLWEYLVALKEKESLI